MASADGFPDLFAAWRPPGGDALPPSPPLVPPPLRSATQGALIESRQRWRDLAGLAADLAFETDAEGRFSFLAPEVVLGWPAVAMLGHRPQELGLLIRPEPDPFALDRPARDVRAWLRAADGSAACLSFTVAPLTGPRGGHAGLRGCARDVTADVAESAAQAEALRRALALEALVRRVREAVLAPRMLPVLLDLLPVAVGCAGAAVVEVPPEAAPAAPLSVPRGAGQPPLRLPDPGVLAQLRADPAHRRPVHTRGAAGEIVALVPQPPALALPGQEALVVWREAGARAFDADERHLLQALSDLLGVVLGHRRLLAELERQARTEPLTGLLNRRAFMEELRRRLERPHQDGGALLFLDVDNLKPVNDRHGHEAGDAVLTGLAALLREAVRSTDLAARIGGDEFALWLDGAGQEEVAAARAAAICAGAAGLALAAPGAGTVDRQLRVTVSIGCAVRAPGTGESAESLLARADLAMYDAKHAGRNAWRLAPPPASPRTRSAAP